MALCNRFAKVYQYMLTKIDYRFGVYLKFICLTLIQVPMNVYEKLLVNNREWANRQVVKDPEFFSRLAGIQNPEFLWIGCSDSRVPADRITATQPGEIFVHRNIANMVVHTDLNLLSVLQYAVEVLKVKHIIVCGHYGCGGVNSAMTQHSFGIINKWLRNIKDVYRLHKDEVDSLPTEEQRLDKMIELNVKEQIMNLELEYKQINSLFFL
jgi:carbonic anhydrase